MDFLARFMDEKGSVLGHVIWLGETAEDIAEVLDDIARFIETHPWLAVTTTYPKMPDDKSDSLVRTTSIHSVHVKPWGSV